MTAAARKFSHYAEPQEHFTKNGGSTVVGVGELPDSMDLVFLGVDGVDPNNNAFSFSHVALTPREAACLANQLLSAAMCFKEIT